MDNSVCFEKFKDYLTNVKKASSNTLSSYLRDIRQFGEYLDSHETVGYTEADEEVLNGYISWLRGMGKSVATVSRSIASLKCFYTFLILQRIVSENPTGKLVPDKCEQKLPQILTSSEVELLLEQPECTDFKGYRDKAMLELLYATGIRVSELISLNVTDVNLTAGAIRCISHDKERFIPLYPAAIRALSEYMEFVRPQMLARKDETSLFVNVSGERMSRQGFLEDHQVLSGQGAHREGHHAAHAAPFLCCASAGKRRGYPCDPGNARPRGYQLHAGLFAARQKAAQGRVPEIASACLISSRFNYIGSEAFQKFFGTPLYFL